MVFHRILNDRRYRLVFWTLLSISADFNSLTGLDYSVFQFLFISLWTVQKVLTTIGITVSFMFQFFRTLCQNIFTFWNFYSMVNWNSKIQVKTISFQACIPLFLYIEPMSFLGWKLCASLSLYGLSSFLIHFKKRPEYLTRGTGQVLSF